MSRLKQMLYLPAIFGMLIVNMMCKTEKKKDYLEDQVEKKEPKVTIVKSEFGTTPEGEAVDRYTLANNSGMTVDIITYGGIITSLKVPNKMGVSQDVVLGFDSLGPYLETHPYFGAIIGRYGNRIAKGKFDLDGVAYSLATNNGENHLHGGDKGYDKVVWEDST